MDKKSIHGAGASLPRRACSKFSGNPPHEGIAVGVIRDHSGPPETSIHEWKGGMREGRSRPGLRPAAGRTELPGQGGGGHTGPLSWAALSRRPSLKAPEWPPWSAAKAPWPQWRSAHNASPAANDRSPWRSGTPATVHWRAPALHQARGEPLVRNGDHPLQGNQTGVPRSRAAPSCGMWA
jgi:hypothetical protein